MQYTWLCHKSQCFKMKAGKHRVSTEEKDTEKKKKCTKSRQCFDDDIHHHHENVKRNRKKSHPYQAHALLVEEQKKSANMLEFMGFECLNESRLFVMKILCVIHSTFWEAKAGVVWHGFVRMVHLLPFCQRKEKTEAKLNKLNLCDLFCTIFFYAKKNL